MSGRPTTEAIHLLRSLMEKYRERQIDLHIVFLDLEKAYDSVPCELVWKTLLDKGTPRRYSRVIKDIGSTAISPYLFTLILDELSRGIQENIPWCMIFADDIVLIAESVKGLNNRLKSWRKALEDNGLRVSKEKTEYLRCDFDRYEVVHQEMDIRIGDQILQPKESFRYMGSVLHRSGRIDDNEEERSEMDWHVKRRLQSPFRRVKPLVVEGSRRRGRPKLRWEDRLKMDMKELSLSEDMTSDRNAWRDRIRISGDAFLIYKEHQFQIILHGKQLLSTRLRMPSCYNEQSAKLTSESVGQNIVQKFAIFVSNHMGGPVGDPDELVAWMRAYPCWRLKFSIPEWVSTVSIINSWLSDAMLYELWADLDGSVAQKIYYSDLPWKIGKLLSLKQVHNVKQLLGISKDTRCMLLCF
ncbi:retrovirus-related pol polyprotein LINE-1 [Tanacetum coccineum]